MDKLKGIGIIELFINLIVHVHAKFYSAFISLLIKLTLDPIYFSIMGDDSIAP